MIPTPKIEHIWYKLRKAKYLSTIDLRSGYHHIPIAEEDCHKSAFVCEYGKFEFKRTSFGISTCPDYLKSLMNKLFFDCDSFCIVYMDDLLVFSESEEEHLKHLEIIFEKFRNADLKLKLSKCQFWKKEIEYLGHLVSQEGIKVMPDKINTVLRIKPLSNIKEAKSALGIMGYVASFIPMYSEVVPHINRLTRKNVPFVWDQKCQNSLDLVKEILTSPTILVYPDPNEKYHLFMDTSNFTWSVALTQERVIQTLKGKESKFLPIAFHSGTFQGSEVNWAAFQKEAAAIHRGIKQLSFYLYEADVVVHSDHKPLAKFIDGMTKNNKVNNWTMECHAICKNITFEYIEGKKNILCDSLTRIQYFDLYDSKDAEKPGHLFGKPDSEELEDSKENEILEIKHSEDEIEEVGIEISTEKLVRLQNEQQQYTHIRKMIKKNPEKLKMLYKVRPDDVLVKIVRSDNHKFEAIMVPDKITKYILHEAHERLGHPGSVKLYLFLRKMYYWPQLKRDCTRHM